MEGSGVDEKDVKEAVRYILQATEEMKGYLPRLAEGQKDLYDKFEALANAVKGLMERILGTEESYNEQLKKLEMTQTTGLKFDERVQSHEEILKLMEERINNLENANVSDISARLDRNDPLFPQDLEIIDSLIDRDPKNEMLLLLKSEILERMGKTKDLLIFLNKATDLRPESALLWYNQGLALRDSFDQSLACFDKSISLLKDDQKIPLHMVHFSKAALLANNERLPEALESAGRSIESNPDCPHGWLQKAKILMGLSRAPEALGCADTGIKKDPNNAHLWFVRGWALSALGKDYWNDAIASFDKVIELERKEDELKFLALFGKGKVLEEEEKHQEALDCLETAIKLNDKDVCAWCHKGIVLNHLDRNDDAVEAFNEALKLGIPSDCSLFYEDLIIVYDSLDRFKEIIELYTKLSESKEFLERLEPESIAHLHNSYAWAIFKERGDYRKGVEVMRSALEIKPDNAMYLDTLACNLQALREDDEALKVFEKALANRKDDTDISWNVLASLYTRVGRIADAEEAVKKDKATNRTTDTPDTP